MFEYMYEIRRNNYNVDEVALYDEVTCKVEKLREIHSLSRKALIEEYLCYFRVSFEVLEDLLKKKSNKAFEKKEEVRKENIRENIINVMNRLKNDRTNGEILEEVLCSSNSEKPKEEEKKTLVEDTTTLTKIKEKLEEGITLCICILTNDLMRITSKNNKNYKEIGEEVVQEENFDAFRESIEEYMIDKDYAYYFCIFYLAISYSFLGDCKKDVFCLYVSLLLCFMVLNEFKNCAFSYKVTFLNSSQVVSCCCSLIIAMICCRLGIIFKELKKFCTSLYFLSYSYLFALALWKQRTIAVTEDLLSLFLTLIQELSELTKEFHYPRIHNFLLFKGIDHLIDSMEWGIQNIEIKKEREKKEREEGVIQVETSENSKEEITRVVLSMYLSMEDYMETCEKYFVGTHMLSVYEQMLLIGSYISKDIHRYCREFNMKQEKKFMKERVYRWSRNLLEVYLMYMKYNYYNHMPEHSDNIETCYRELWEEFYIYEASRSLNGVSEILIDMEINAQKKKKNSYIEEMSEEFENVEDEEKRKREIYIEHLKIMEQTYLEETISVPMKDILNEQMEEFQKRDIVPDFDGIKLFDKNLAYESFIEFLRLNKMQLYQTVENDPEKKHIYKYTDDEECVLSFKLCFKRYLTKVDKVTEEIIKIIECDKRRNPQVPLNIEIAREFMNMFAYDSMSVGNFLIQVYNYSNSYKKKVDKKLNKKYTEFYATNDNKEFRPILLENCEKEIRFSLQLSYVHYICYNPTQMELLFRSAQKYFRKTTEYFSLYKQTTLYLDIVLNSRARYMYMNFFTNNFDFYKSNLMDCMKMLLLPVDHLKHEQYEQYKKTLIDEATEIAQELFVCTKLGVCLKSLYYKDYHVNKEKYLLDNILIKNTSNSFYTLNEELQRKLFTIINLHSKYLKCFKRKENSEELIFPNEDEAMKYFYTYLHLCQLLQHLDSKEYVQMAFNHYKLVHSYLTNYNSNLKEAHKESIILICNRHIQHLENVLKQIN